MVQTSDDEMVLTAVKTPMMPRAATAFLPRTLTLAQALAELRKLPPKDAHGTRVQQQLERETAGKYDFLAVTRTGEIIKVKPTTALQDIVMPREIRTAQGIEEMPTAAFEVQAYAPVGGATPC